jgi:RNA polymerase sigma factor (sigma-70 family)
VGEGVFPLTRDSIVARVKSDDPKVRAAAWDRVAAVYYKPVYKHLRLKWHTSPEEAEDLAQHFFEKALEREMFATYDPLRARFRTFVRLCVDRLVSNHQQAQRRLKRGGGGAQVSLDAHGAEAELAGIVEPDDVDRQFDQEWARNVLAISVERLRERLGAAGKEKHFQAFAAYDLADERPSYAEVAERLGLSASDVNNYLVIARRQLRTTVLSVLREVTASEEEFEEESRSLLGIDPRGK